MPFWILGIERQIVFFITIHFPSLYLGISESGENGCKIGDNSSEIGCVCA